MYYKAKLFMDAEYSIEYGHFYTNELFNGDHQAGIKKLRMVTQNLETNHQSYSLCVLIDNYNAPVISENVQDFWQNLRQNEALPHYWAYEGDLSHYVEITLDQLHPKTKKEYLAYIEHHQHIPCSLFIIIWYYLRLGIIEDTEKVIEKISPTDTTFSAKNLITILPKRFEQVEDIALRAIKRGRHKDIGQRITLIFF